LRAEEGILLFLSDAKNLTKTGIGKDSFENPLRRIRIVQAQIAVLRPQNAILSASCNFVNDSRNRQPAVAILMEKKMTSKSLKNSSKAKKAELAGHRGGPEGPSGRFWTQRIEPKGAALLAQTLMPSHFVIKNHGPGPVSLVAHDGDLMDLPPGAVRATYARGTITVKNTGEKSVLIEFDFLPNFIFKR
jgi:hypothetical protein